MKFFGWGRKKDPPPTLSAHQELKKSDASCSAQGPGTKEYGTRYGCEPVGHGDPLVTPQQKVTFSRPSKYFFEEVGNVGSETWEEKLQETIRFVFSHEQEGLLTIGTFALDQLAGVTRLDGRQVKSPANNYNSRHNSVSSVHVAIRDVRSSDDETESQHSKQSPILSTACRRKESYPIFDDHDTFIAGLHCRALSFGSTNLITAKEHPSCTISSRARTHAVAEIKQDLPSIIDRKNCDQSDSEDFYSRGGCSLFASRSRRTQKGMKENQLKPPEKLKGDGGSYELNRTDYCKRLLGAHLGRLWRSGCSGPVSTKVTPEKEQSSDSLADHRESQAQGPPCIANIDKGGTGAPGVSKPPQAPVGGKQRKKRGPSFGKGWGCSHNGKWIRTDAEFVVLEM